MGKYLVQWKGFSPAHTQWVNEDDLFAPKILVAFKQRRGQNNSASDGNGNGNDLAPETVPPVPLKRGRGRPQKSPRTPNPEESNSGLQP
ncbi:hypothetical protein TWF569_004784 [Orbilia oligospora]|nr:hypothetical protein TWF569_004784 [Orbilia oligospora]